MDKERKCARPEPPGHFVSDDLRQQTAQFLEELRRRLKREKSPREPKLGPPPQ
jgi:hypothetical protein